MIGLRNIHKIPTDLETLEKSGSNIFARDTSWYSFVLLKVRELKTNVDCRGNRISVMPDFLGSSSYLDMQYDLLPIKYSGKYLWKSGKSQGTFFHFFLVGTLNCSITSDVTR